uniref:Uncharacterized protein n=1 Tax=Anopheles culicifacies TaxID=139723 RepID=A0A182MDM2_9DIPT
MAATMQEPNRWSLGSAARVLLCEMFFSAPTDDDLIHFNDPEAAYRRYRADVLHSFPSTTWKREPCTTALHWAAKHGNEDVVKLVAGKLKADVNARTSRNVHASKPFLTLLLL